MKMNNYSLKNRMPNCYSLMTHRMHNLFGIFHARNKQEKKQESQKKRRERESEREKRRALDE